ELLQDHRADLRRAVLLAAGLDDRVTTRTRLDLVGHDRLFLLDLGLLAAHEALDREDRVLGVGHRLALGNGAHEPLTAARKCHYRRSRAPTFGVLDHRRLAALEHGHTGVGRPEVDSDRLSHVCLLLFESKNLSESVADLGRPVVRLYRRYV